jgi:hypothetical protein
LSAAPAAAAFDACDSFVRRSIHTRTHTDRHIDTQTLTHAHTHTYIHTYIHTHTHADTQSQIRRRIYKYTVCVIIVAMFGHMNLDHFICWTEIR